LINSKSVIKYFYQSSRLIRLRKRRTLRIIEVDGLVGGVEMSRRKRALEMVQFKGSTPKRDRGRPWTVRPDETYGRAQNYRGILEVIWDRFWPTLAKTQTVEEVTQSIKEHGRPYDQTFEPLAGLIFQVLREPTFPTRPNAQKRFLADSLGAFGVVSPRRSRDICAGERAKDQRKHRIIRYEYYVECTCGYQGPSKDRACRSCGARIPASLFG
jgi:hypothetical protein